MRQVFLSVILTVMLAIAAPAMAQDNQAIDFQEWETVATQAEELSRQSDATEEQLTEMRQKIAEWRGELQAGQNANSGRIASVREQIAALGPAPAEGETEDEAIAGRRADFLNRPGSYFGAPGWSKSDSSRKNIPISPIYIMFRPI